MIERCVPTPATTYILPVAPRLPVAANGLAPRVRLLSQAADPAVGHAAQHRCRLRLRRVTSFTPLVGLHIVLGCLMALIVRGNFLAVAVGTLVGNPWTFPFMWLAGYELGKLMLGPDIAGRSRCPGESRTCPSTSAP